MVVFTLRTEWNGTGQNGMIEKKEREQKDLADGPCSRKERNKFKKCDWHFFAQFFTKYIFYGF